MGANLRVNRVQVRERDQGEVEAAPARGSEDRCDVRFFSRTRRLFCHPLLVPIPVPVPVPVPAGLAQPAVAGEIGRAHV